MGVLDVRMPTDYEIAKAEFEKWFTSFFRFANCSPQWIQAKNDMWQGYLAGFNRALEMVTENHKKVWGESGRI